MKCNKFFFGDVPLDVVGEYWSEANEFFIQHFRQLGHVRKDAVHYNLHFCSTEKDVLMQNADNSTVLARLIPEHYTVHKNEPPRPYFRLQMLYDTHHLQYLYFSS